MSCFRVAIIAAALIASAASVHAADMPRDRLPFPRYEEKPLRVDEFVSGWYLRGDIGWRFQRIGGASDTVNGEYATKSLKDTAMFGFGGGYKFSWFRLDLTGDYGWRSRFSATSSTGATTVDAKFDSFTLLANGYLDLGTWWGFTPYIGGGIGGAYLTLSGYESSPATVGTVSANSRWNLAWAAMAGVSRHIMHNVLLDVGYRHIEMGKISGGPSTNPLTLRNVRGDEVRVGVRILLD